MAVMVWFQDRQHHAARKVDPFAWRCPGWCPANYWRGGGLEWMELAKKQKIGGEPLDGDQWFGFPYGFIFFPWRLPAHKVKETYCNKSFFRKQIETVHFVVALVDWKSRAQPNVSTFFRCARVPRCNPCKCSVTRTSCCLVQRKMQTARFGNGNSWLKFLALKTVFPGADTDIWCLGRLLRTGQVWTVGRVWIREAQAPQVCQGSKQFTTVSTCKQRVSWTISNLHPV